MSMARTHQTLVMLSTLRAEDVMVTDPVAVADHESLALAWELLARGGCRFLPVVRSGRVVGVIDDHAMVLVRSTKWRDGRARTVGDVVSRARTIGGDTPLPQVVELLAGGCGVLIVVDGDGRPEGLITADAVVRLLDKVMADQLVVAPVAG